MGVQERGEGSERRAARPGGAGEGVDSDRGRKASRRAWSLVGAKRPMEGRGVCTWVWVERDTPEIKF